MKGWKVTLLSLSSVLLLAACAGDSDDSSTPEVDQQTEDIIEEAEPSREAGQEDGDPVIPDGMLPAVNPTYFKGDPVILTAEHLPGMSGAEAEIVDAFDTIAYSVSYEDADTGEAVDHHKWVVHEELGEADHQEEAFSIEDQVTLEASNLPGMQGQAARIEEVLETTVYVVDYQPTDGGEAIQNYQWITEEEMEPGI